MPILPILAVLGLGLLVMSAKKGGGVATGAPVSATDEATAVAKAIKYEQDPSKLRTFAARLQEVGATSLAAQLTARAAQVDAMPTPTVIASPVAIRATAPIKTFLSGT